MVSRDGRRGDRALMLAAADFSAVSLRYPFLAFRPFEGKSRGLDPICSVPKAPRRIILSTGRASAFGVAFSRCSTFNLLALLTHPPSGFRAFRVFRGHPVARQSLKSSSLHSRDSWANLLPGS